MLRLSVLALGAYAAVCMSSSPTSANDVNHLGCVMAEGAQQCVSTDINLHCSAPRLVPRPFDRKPPALAALSALAPLDQLGTSGAPPPWISNIGRDYRVNLSNSTVNGEIQQIDQIDNQIYAKVVLKLAWHRPADASVPAAHYVLDLATNGIVVSFDNDEYDGRNFASTALRLRCTRPLPENS
jgi:hypothetical protein